MVEDLERAAAALTARTAPLVPGCGVLVAVSGLAAKAETPNPIADTFVSLAVFFAIGGFAFLARALFLYAGRRSVGLSPTIDDIAFARDRLVRKHTSSHRGGLLAGVALTCLSSESLPASTSLSTKSAPATACVASFPVTARLRLAVSRTIVSPASSRTHRQARTTRGRSVSAPPRRQPTHLHARH